MTRRSSTALSLLPLSASLLIGCASAQSLDAQSGQLKAAIDAAERGQLGPGQAAALSRHPAYGWVEFAQLRRNIDTVDSGQAQAFLKRYDGQAVANSFRSVWLPSVARRQDWPTLLANWAPTDNLGLRCAQLTARQATGKVDPQWISEAQDLWRKNGKSLPDACDAVFAVLQAQGGMSDALRWERVDAAADAQQPAVMRSAARGLPAADLTLANTYAAFVDKPNASALRAHV